MLSNLVKTFFPISRLYVPTVICDVMIGQCGLCKSGFGGLFCTECNCNLQGSKNNKCRPDSGKCECKDGYSGIHCDFDFPIGENFNLH